MSGMRRIVFGCGVLAVIATGSALALGAVASGSGGQPACGPASVTTLRQQHGVRLFARSSKEGRDVYACSVGMQGWRRLGPFRHGYLGAGVTGPFAISSEWVVGIEQRGSGVDTLEFVSSALNLRSGLRHRCVVGEGHSPGQSRLKRVLLAPSGGTASITLVHSWPSHSPQIVACGSTGRKILDEGPGIDLQSIALHGSTLVWVDSGTERSAHLR